MHFYGWFIEKPMRTKASKPGVVVVHGGGLGQVVVDGHIHSNSSGVVLAVQCALCMWKICV